SIFFQERFFLSLPLDRGSLELWNLEHGDPLLYEPPSDTGSARHMTLSPTSGDRRGARSRGPVMTTGPGRLMPFPLKFAAGVVFQRTLAVAGATAFMLVISSAPLPPPWHNLPSALADPGGNGRGNNGNGNGNGGATGDHQKKDRKDSEKDKNDNNADADE